MYPTVALRGWIASSPMTTGATLSLEEELLLSLGPSAPDTALVVPPNVRSANWLLNVLWFEEDRCGRVLYKNLLLMKILNCIPLLLFWLIKFRCEQMADCYIYLL